MVRQVLIASADSGLVGTVVADAGMVLLALFAMMCAAVAAARAHGRHRTAWISLAVGLCGWSVSRAIWTVEELHIGTAPALVGATALVYPVGACVGLVLLASGTSSWTRARLVLDGVTIGLSVFALGWVVVLRDGFAVGAEHRWQPWLAVASPVADLVLVAVAVIVLTTADRGQRGVLVLLTAGTVLGAASNIALRFVDVWGSDPHHRLIDLGWCAALTCLAFAALRSRYQRKPLVASNLDTIVAPRWTAAIPVTSLVMATVICCIQLMQLPAAGCAPMAIAVVLLVVATVVRRVVTYNENQRLRATASELLQQDRVTGLDNAVSLRELLSRRLSRADRGTDGVVVARLDVDELALVTAAYGRGSGDELLNLAAGRIRASVGRDDVVARLDSGQFAVLVDGGVEHGRAVADCLVQAFADPFFIDGHDLMIGSSVGLAVAASTETDLTADGLLARATAAVQIAKNSHLRTAYIHGTGSDNDDTATALCAPALGVRPAETVRLLGQLRQAIDSKALCLYYQPKLDLVSGETMGVEALLRWPHPELGLLAPDRFLPLVRSHGLTTLVNDLVIERALDDVARWRSDGFEIPVAVNVFANCLTDIALPRRIAKALDDRRIPAADLTLEITEDFMLSKLGRVQYVLNGLRHIGVRVAIDDFGSGYSTLSYLRDLPVDEVKLDRQFISSVLNDERAAEIVRAIISLAHHLGARVVAEGVEDGETATQLKHFKCDVVQGYLYSTPIAADRVPAWLRDRPEASPGAARPVGATI
ncbi:bifunctional diguanylate cyclase/phosphodiesterase [Mycolicibacterium sp. CBMA 226]|uniref:putative bifunctional diguanylate cyclase/phosphodiesterase n=1 Tax=Mycolicibacterium sp. CBMA 226 TaxID=2606611 RepID=UPI0012DE7AE5|nr:bifunctional diguanylate cyclase/phosphodiesterase [Mycolicibacterium sp. CBMA 226]MUL78131.1 bifunctional diguanylate cyclase/phosphodiesterase [Mycolicibacterium sp. CBMA 226]